MKKFIILLLLIGLGAGGYYFWQKNAQDVDETTNKPKTTKVERGSIFSIVDTTGKVVSLRDVEIKCKSSGQVIKLPYDVSHCVKQGELLVELDPVDEQRSVQQSKVNLAASRARLAQAEQNLKIAETKLVSERKKADVALKSALARANETQAKMKRLKELVQSKLTSQSDYEAAEASAIEATSALERTKIEVEALKVDEMALEVKKNDIELAKTQVELDDIDLSKALQRLNETKVFAPIDGVVSEQKIQIGQIISSGISNVGGGTAIMILSDLSHIFVVASVDESDIGKIALNQPAIITTDAYPDRKFPGKVVLISTKGQTTSNVVTFEVKIEVLGEKHLLKPEMTASVKVIPIEKRNALIVPSESVYQKIIENEHKKIGAEITMSGDEKSKKRYGKENGSSKNSTDEEDAENTSEVSQNQQKNKDDNSGSVNPEEWMTKRRIRQIYQVIPRQYCVQILKEDGTTDEREIKVGIDDGTKTEILEGVQEGENVILDKGYSQSRWQNDANMNRGRPRGMRGI